MTSQHTVRSVQRIISLPITRPKSISKLPLRPVDHSKILTYYHFQLHASEARGKEKTGGASTSRWKPEGGWVKWAQAKAAQTWAGFGKAPEGSWKLKVFRGGERLVDRIDFEELALKGVDPSLGPTIRHPDFSGKGQDAGSTTKPLYLMALIEKRAIVPEGSTTLDGIYKEFGPKLLRASSPASTSSDSPTDRSSETPKGSPGTDNADPDSDSDPDSTSELLLSREAVPAVIDVFNLEKGAAADMYRAVEQAQTRN
ncbi:hypothetical protein VNI00_002712 [Paramarasmius palmivorus]|uniref:Uncharacterized protein n=1 Tax=Paramarasmius palmivorus TaxID=297713 RepID=A0AAW0DVH9_9AGAR